MIGMFPFELLGGLFTTGVLLMLAPGDWIVMLVFAALAGTANAGLGQLIWRLTA